MKIASEKTAQVAIGLRLPMCAIVFCMLTAACAQAYAASVPSYGILLMAHGGNADWNREIARIGAKLGSQAPTEVALGMADALEIQKAVERLEAKKVGKIVAVPLFINSASEVMDQTRYVLGINEKPSLVLKESLARIPHDAMQGHHHAFSEDRVSVKLPVVLTPALDEHPAVEQVLYERAKGLSKDPARETIILVGHGPVDDNANDSWLKTMRDLAQGVQKRGGFKARRVATIRDDSRAEAKTKAARDLRLIVEQAREGGGRAIVIPYLIARGGVEDHIVAILKGLDYSWDGKTLCPHPAIARWAAEVAAKGAKEDNMRVYNKGEKK